MAFLWLFWTPAWLFWEKKVGNTDHTDIKISYVTIFVVHYISTLEISYFLQNIIDVIQFHHYMFVFTIAPNDISNSDIYC